MRVSDPHDDAVDQPVRFFGRWRDVSEKDVEGGTIDERHQEGRCVVDGENVAYRDDVGVFKRGLGAGFPHQTAPQGVVWEREDLQRVAGAEALVAHCPDLGGSTGTQQVLDHVAVHHIARLQSIDRPHRTRKVAGQGLGGVVDGTVLFVELDELGDQGPQGVVGTAGHGNGSGTGHRVEVHHFVEDGLGLTISLNLRCTLTSGGGYHRTLAGCLRAQVPRPT